jgi:hypothetical protein
LSTRARTSKRHILETGHEGYFRVYTNPGGPASNTLRDFFIDHTPNWEDFPPELQRDYKPDQWVFIPGELEDNPYLPPSYESDLAVLQPWRYKQLRYGDWDAVGGLYFDDFSKNVHVATLEQLGWSDERAAQHLEWFCSHDWGYISPGCMLWWVCLPDGHYHIRYEHKFSHKLCQDLAADYRDIEKDLGNPYIRYRVSDPAIEGPESDKGESIRETYANNGIFFDLGKNRREIGWQRVRQMLGLLEDNKPVITIHPSCRYLIRSFSTITSDPRNPEDVDTNADDHGMDAFRYGAMSRPSPSRVKSVKSGRTFKAIQERMLKTRKMLNVR